MFYRFEHGFARRRRELLALRYDGARGAHQLDAGDRTAAWATLGVRPMRAGARPGDRIETRPVLVVSRQVGPPAIATRWPPGRGGSRPPRPTGHQCQSGSAKPGR